jgi:tRNA-dihydrouridine synthase
MLARGAIHNPKIFTEYKEELYEDIQDNDFDNDYEEVDKEEECEKEIKKNSKNKNKDFNAGGDDVQASTKLAKVFENKYKGVFVDIIPQVKEYIEISLKCGNNFHNTKYVVLYILKTHKKHLMVFQKIQTCKNFIEMCKILELEEIYENVNQASENIKQYYDNAYYKSQFKEKQKNKNNI